MTHPWRIIALALLCCYLALWLLLYLRSSYLTRLDRAMALPALLLVGVGVVTVLLAAWGWNR